MMPCSDSSSRDYDLLIIGAGPAGLGAALEAHGQNWKTAIIDYHDKLGGQTTHYTCKADIECRSCGVCQVSKTADAVCKSQWIDIILNTEVTACQHVDNTFSVTLQNHGSSIKSCHVHAKRIVFATGFNLFDLHEKPALGFDRYDNVISLDTIEKTFYENTDLQTLLPENHSDNPDVGFIQCVGSRENALEANYCSQVCCRVSLKLSNLIKYRYPDWQIKIFYMDLQASDNASRKIASTPDTCELIRCIPSDIHQNQNGKLILRYESQESHEPIEKEFDLIVLASAIRPHSPLSAMCDNAKFKDRTGIAGTAARPMDIIQSINHGRQTVLNLSETFTGEFNESL